MIEFKTSNIDSDDKFEDEESENELSVCIALVQNSSGVRSQFIWSTTSSSF